MIDIFVDRKLSLCPFYVPYTQIVIQRTVSSPLGTWPASRQIPPGFPCLRLKCGAAFPNDQNFQNVAIVD